MIEVGARLINRGRIEARCRRGGTATVSTLVRLGWRTIVGARWRLPYGVIFDMRVLDGMAIIDPLPLRDGRTMVEAFALIPLPDAGSRSRMRLLPLDRGVLLGMCVLFRCPTLLDARFRRIAVAVIVGVRGYPEGGETQGRNDECGCRASRHVLRGCARTVATTSQAGSLGFAAD
jgi:hypothetical protein